MSHPSHADAPRVPPTLFLSDEDVAALADWRAAIDTLAAAYATPMSAAAVPPRSMARGDKRWLRGLSAVSPTGRMGCKLIAASMSQRQASYLIALYDGETAALSALIDGNRITGLRTAATAVVAVRAVAPQRPLTVGVIGSGFEAQGLVAALCASLPTASVRVFSPTPASRERFAERFRASHQLDIVATDTAQQAVQGADVVLCAARSRDESPVLLGEWLAPGMTVVSLGSTLQEQREVDPETLKRAACIVADMPDEVLHETGDALAAAQAGVDVAARMVSLADVISGRVVARRSPDDIVVYKSVGSALQDVVVAEMLYERAKAQGKGQPMAQSIVPVSK